MKNTAIVKLININLQLASIVDDPDSFLSKSISKELGMGYRVISPYIRQGVKGILDLQEELAVVKGQLSFMKAAMEEQKERFCDLFGETKIEELSENEKNRIRTITNQTHLSEEREES
ncbi:MAG: hypothetical protein Q4B26_06125 [Eubacteriales bacterium]|nr:hypothetical protein [Eubacteriales bacterium]